MLKDELEKKVVEEELVKDETIEKEEIVEDKDEDIQNIDLSVFNKKKFSINGNPDIILELDVSDLNVVTRLKENYPKLDKLLEKAHNTSEKISKSEELDTMFNETADMLKEIDVEMRNIIDTIFDTNVSEVCVPSGSMYDPIGGKVRYEHIIDVLFKLYDTNLRSEVQKVKNRVSKHTTKYNKKK